MLRRICFPSVVDSKNSLSNRSYSSKPTYYDILNLKQDCTAKEIRNSFLKLSKKCHPDVRGLKDAKNTNEYLKIMEAYQCLIKKDDDYMIYRLKINHSQAATIISIIRVQKNTYNMYIMIIGRLFNLYLRTWRLKPDINSNPGSYYGVKGLEKMSNMKIVGILLFIATVGTIFEFYLVRNSMTFRRDLLNEKSRQASLQHSSVRADAEKYGNEIQLERITKKILQNKTP